MTVYEFPLPDLGEGLPEGEILRWLVTEGDEVTQNQPIVEVETAKAAVEIPAKWPGRIVRVFHPEGATVAVGAPLVAIDTDPTGPGASDDAAAGGGNGAGGSGAGGSGDAASYYPAAMPAATGGAIGEETAGGRTAVLVGYGPRTGAAKRRPRKTASPASPASPAAASPASPAAASPAAASPASPAAASPASPGESAEVRVLAKPPVRKLARDLGVDLRTLTGTGPAGSISRADVQAAVAAPAPAGTHRPGQREQRIAVKGVRKLTATNVSASAFTAPHVTEFLTLDMTRGMRALDRLRRQPEWREVRVSPLLLVAKAVLLAIRRHPMINSTWDEPAGEIVVKDYVNLGIAAATERGLIVPNIKDAGELSLRELADAMSTLVETARVGRTTPTDMSGGTFTVTNVGVFGVDTGTPILPPGEAAILAFGAVRQAPWVHKGKVKARQVTTLGLSFDHRIVDGELGSRFLADVGAFLGDPETMLLAWS